MNFAERASKALARAQDDLNLALRLGPDPRQLRLVADLLGDAAADLRQAAGDIEMGIAT
jgi:hypothetical protein